MGAYCAIPPETYGSFTANSGSGFILGMAGSSTPSVYNRQSLALNSNSHLQIIGPVVLTVGIGMTVNSTVGNLDNPNWLEIRIASGGVILFCLTSGDTNFFGMMASAFIDRFYDLVKTSLVMLVPSIVSGILLKQVISFIVAR